MHCVTCVGTDRMRVSKWFNRPQVEVELMKRRKVGVSIYLDNHKLRGPIAETAFALRSGYCSQHEHEQESVEP